MTWSSLHLTGGWVGRWAAKCNKGACFEFSCTWMHARPCHMALLWLPPASLPLSLPFPPACQAARAAGAQGASGGRGPRLQQRLHDR